MTIDDVIASLNYHRGEVSQSVGKPIIVRERPDTVCRITGSEEWPGIASLTHGG